MGNNRITRYVEIPSRIARRVEMAVLQPDPLHLGWTNFVSQKSVRAIAISPKTQCMWLATWGGVLSWNRTQELVYHRYSSEHGLAGNAVACLCIDQDSRVWTGHDEGGLSYFDSQQWRVYQHLQTVPIRAIASAVSLEGIWVASTDTVYYISHPDRPPTPVVREHDGAFEAITLLANRDGVLLGNAWGLFHLRSGQQPVAIAPDTIRTCTALTRDGNGNIWAGTNEGIYQLSEEDLSIISGLQTTNSIGRVLGLAAGNKRVWVLTLAGLIQVVEGQWMSVPWNSELGEQPKFQAIALSTSDSSLWVGTDSLLAGVQSTQPEETRWDLDILPKHSDDKLNNLGRCLVADNSKVWVGTAGGLVAFDADNKWSYHTPNIDVRSIGNSQGGESLWMLAWPMGVRQIFSSSRLDELKQQPSGLATLLSVGNDGCPYILTGRALWRLDTDKLQEIGSPPPALARSLVQTVDGVWWLGTVRGLYRLVAGRWEFIGTQPGPLQAEVYAAVEIDHILWVATEMGLWAHQGDSWVLHESEEAGATSPVWALAAGELGRLWLASESGVWWYDPKTQIRGATYTPANSGLGSRRVVALLENAGALWIVTQVGISRLNFDGRI